MVIGKATQSIASRLAATPLRHATFAVNAGLIALLAYSAGALVWQLVPAPALPVAPLAMAAGPGPTPPAAGEQYGDRIAAQHMFGRAAPLERTDAPPLDAPETRLELTLRGVLHSRRDDWARVIIAQGNRDEALYRVGDALPGGATLQAIHPDRVILRREGRYETLTMPRERLGAEAPATVAAHNGGVDRARVSQLRQRLLRSPAEFNRLVQAEPYLEDGAFRGVRLQPGLEAGALEAAGLRPGDVVTAINGEPLDGPEAAMGVMRHLRSGQGLELSVLRDGVLQSIRIEFQ